MCQNSFINLPDKIGLFINGASLSLVAKNGTKKNSTTKEKIIYIVAI